MTLLITGASGLLGANLVLAALDAGWTVTGVTRSRPLVASVGSQTVDLSIEGAADDLFRRVRPSVVIHTAAATDVDGCESDPVSAFKANEQMARFVATAAASAGARLIHISTDAVFAGDAAGGYAEADATMPASVYGKSKLAGEQAVLAAYPGALIVRTTIYGFNAQKKRSLAEYFLDRFLSGARAPGFIDAAMSPILANDLADRLLRMAGSDVAGRLHVAGRECISKADFGRRLASAFGFSEALVDPVSIQSARFKAPRARWACLRVDAAARLLGRLPDVDEGISRFRSLYEAGYPRRLQALLEETA